MNIESLIDDHKDSIEKLLGKLDLSPKQMSSAVSSSKEVVGNLLSNETNKNGLNTLLNLFSDDDNSSQSNSFLQKMDKSLIKKLISKGFDKKKAGSIKDIVLPFVIKIITSKIGGKSDVLGSLLEGVVSKKGGGLTSVLSKFFK